MSTYMYRTAETEPTPSWYGGSLEYQQNLFDRWIKEGWEVVSVTIVPTLSQNNPFKVIGVLRKERPA